MDISEHLEVLDHEFDQIDTHLYHSGYRVDGTNGIKNIVGLPARKSVDYFCILNGRCVFVEFTDLAQGQEDLLGIHNTISAIDNDFHKNTLAKLLKKDQRRELVEKFKDSKDIFLKISSFYENVPKELLDHSAKVFYIVCAPINIALEDNEKAEIGRFISTLQSRVSSCLEDDICSRVKLVFLEHFITELG
ncbi:MAG: hypothetical protein ACJA2M_002032 [Polaribacter sp.]|jgi:hypothetical protein